MKLPNNVSKWLDANYDVSQAKGSLVYCQLTGEVTHNILLWAGDRPPAKTAVGSRLDGHVMIIRDGAFVTRLGLIPQSIAKLPTSAVSSTGPAKPFALDSSIVRGTVKVPIAANLRTDAFIDYYLKDEDRWTMAKSYDDVILDKKAPSGQCSISRNDMKGIAADLSTGALIPSSLDCDEVIMAQIAAKLAGVNIFTQYHLKPGGLTVNMDVNSTIPAITKLAAKTVPVITAKPGLSRGIVLFTYGGDAREFKSVSFYHDGLEDLVIRFTPTIYMASDPYPDYYCVVAEASFDIIKVDLPPGKAIPSDVDNLGPAIPSNTMGLHVLSGLPELQLSGDCTFELSEANSIEDSGLTFRTLEMLVSEAWGELTYETFSGVTLGNVAFGRPAHPNADTLITSWKDTSSILFRCKTLDVGGRRVSQLKAYADYGKQRARACKTNNFLELDYVDGIKYKTVDNKLQETTSMSVWLADGSLTNAVSVQPATTGSIGSKVTLSGTTFTVTRSTGEVGTFSSKDATSLHAMMDFIGDEPIVSGITAVISAIKAVEPPPAGAESAPASTLIRKETRSESLKNKGYIVDLPQSTVSKWEILDKDAQIHYLMRQLFAFKATGAGIKKFLVSFSI